MIGSQLQSAPGSKLLVHPVLSIRRTGCLEGGGCVSSGLSLGSFHPPTLHHGWCSSFVNAAFLCSLWCMSQCGHAVSTCTRCLRPLDPLNSWSSLRLDLPIPILLAVFLLWVRRRWSWMYSVVYSWSKDARWHEGSNYLQWQDLISKNNKIYVTHIE